MPQARLPDINTAYIKYRNETIWALKNKMYNLMHGSLVGINALLPLEYQVIISTTEYEQLAKTEITYLCTHCDAHIDKQDVSVFDLQPNSIETLVHGKMFNKVWICIKCHKVNMLDKTAISQTILQNPTFLGLVPEPPTRKNGLMDKLKFDIEIERWAWLCLGELEFKMAKFRDDNWNRKDEEMGDIDNSLDDKEAGGIA